MTTPPPPPSDDAGGRSGRAFVLGCLALCVALVAVFVFVSPRLLEATRADAPDLPPVEVATGEIDGTRWRVTAVRTPEDRTCAEVTVDGQRARMVCGNEEGPSAVRAMDAIAVGDAALVTTVTDPYSVEVAIAHAEGSRRVDVVYADFGFPLGFAAAAVPAPVARVSTYDDQGELHGRADCRLGGDDHDPQRHVTPPIMVGTGDVITGGCLLTE